MYMYMCVYMHILLSIDFFATIQKYNFAAFRILINKNRIALILTEYGRNTPLSVSEEPITSEFKQVYSFHHE